MRNLYSILVRLAWFILKIITPFNRKLHLFVKGRKSSFSIIESSLNNAQKVIWMHVASLGEYEQGLPVLQALRKQYPDHKLLLTFFSPSGYEVKKDKSPADAVAYLPMDTRSNAQRFLATVKPNLAIFIKYEVWPNYLFELKKQDVPTLLVSGIFSKRQSYFKWYGGFLRKALGCFSHFFVQDVHSQALLSGIGFKSVSVSGDTRFDRVSQILAQDNHLPFMEAFVNGQKCLIAGSTWPEDEEVLVPFINQQKTNIKFVLAPHNIKSAHIQKLQDSIDQKVVCYSSMDPKALPGAQVLIVDTIGLLTKIYSYASAAYVGGGFATGLHNTLEPAVFGIPVIIGPQYSDFLEAKELVSAGGVLSVNDKEAFDAVAHRLFTEDAFYRKTARTNADYLSKKTGATARVMQHLLDNYNF